MKILILLLLVVSCGKGADGKKSSTPVQNLAIVQPAEEMVMTICGNDKDCTEACLAKFFECVNPCGGQGPAQSQFHHDCQDRCQTGMNACYNSPKEITKEAWLLITGPTG